MMNALKDMLTLFASCWTVLCLFIKSSTFFLLHISLPRYRAAVQLNHSADKQVCACPWLTNIPSLVPQRGLVELRIVILKDTFSPHPNTVRRVILDLDCETVAGFMKVQCLH